MGVKSLYENIYLGKSGRNIGISTGLPDVDKVIFGIQRKYIYTVGADTSGGKTSFALDIFIYNLFKNSPESLRKKLNILYYSFEMSNEVLYAKLLSRYIFDQFKKIIPYKDILSFDTPLSDELLGYVDKGKHWLVEIEKNLTIYDKPLSPNAIYATSKEWLSKFGLFEKVGEHREEYVEFDTESYKIILIDHVGLIGGPGTKKEKIDLTVDYLIHFRNKCNITGVLIQQMNRNSKSMERKTSGYELYQLDDFKDTSGTTDASEVVLALYYPFREKISKCEGYPIEKVLKKRFRLCQILKNRYGEADLNKGLLFYGEVGMFLELPRPEEITDYDQYLTLNSEPVNMDEIDDIDEVDNKNINIYTF